MPIFNVQFTTHDYVDSINVLKPRFHKCIFGHMLPIFKKDGVIVDGADRAEMALFLGQPYPYIDLAELALCPIESTNNKVIS